MVKIIPLTGKLHQIRIHLSYIGHPIANDSKYGNKTFNKEIKKLKINRMLLHSKTIKFKCPISKKIYEINAKYDSNMQTFIDNMENIENV